VPSLRARARLLTHFSAYQTENDIRYTPFDLEALTKIACEVMGARACTLFEKLEEGVSSFLIHRIRLKTLVDGLQDHTTRLFV
jgi:hypothetical protein